MAKMNPNWFRVKIQFNGVFPKRIMNLSKKLNVPAEEIAEKEGISGDVFAFHSIRRDLVKMIVDVGQLPESLDECIIQFMDGREIICWEDHGKLISRIDKFLRMEPTIELTPMPSLAVHEMTEEELAEMGYDPYYPDEK